MTFCTADSTISAPKKMNPIKDLCISIRSTWRRDCAGRAPADAARHGGAGEGEGGAVDDDGGGGSDSGGSCDGDSDDGDDDSNDDDSSSSPSSNTIQDRPAPPET